MSKTSLLTVILITLLIAAPSAPPPGGECDCNNLEDLQKELRSAIKLQQTFAGKVASLRAMSNRESAAIEFSNFAESLRKPVTRPASGKGPVSIDYVSKGELISPDDKGNVTGTDLCGKSPGAEQDLHDLDTGAVCIGIAKAVRAHEDYHQADCTRMTYASYRDKHAADRAAEEAAAYGAQIAYLRAEIARVLEKSNLRFESVMDSKTKVPPNPLYTTITADTKANLKSTSVSATPDLIKFTMQGEHWMNASVDQNCTMTGGLPYTTTARGIIETDGLDAKLSYTIEGTTPAMSMKCTIGGGTGFGMSIPVPIKAEASPSVSVPLKNGAQAVIDMATTDGAKLLAQGGMSLTGKATITLYIDCPK